MPTQSEVTVTLTGDQWRSVLSGEWNDQIGFDEGVTQAIINALCPEGHTEEIRYKKYVSPNFSYVWGYGNCAVCFATLWGIFHNNVAEGTYRYWDALNDNREQVVFTPGDENDPHKLDLIDLSIYKDGYEWQTTFKEKNEQDSGTDS